MKVTFRADASLDMGTGHVVRCITLARALAERGAEIAFICREHEGHLADRIAAQGFGVSLLAREALGKLEYVSDYALWVGATVAMDAAQSVAAMTAEPPDWVVVDHYGLGADWESIVRGAGPRVLAIDDLANRHHACNALVDQNYFANSEARYQGVVPTDCSLWLGPRYALLQSAFAGRRRLVLQDEKVQRVLIFVGGGDRSNLTGALLLMLSAPAFASLHLDVVLGPNHEHSATVQQLAAARPRTEVHQNLPSLVELMVSADLAIGAGGGATWERLCVGLPSIVFSLAPNQDAVCWELSNLGLINFAGRLEDFNDAAFSAKLIQLIEDPVRRRDQALKGQALVDGLGASRIAELLMPTRTDRLVCRSATAGDMLSYFNWANDAAVRTSAMNTSPIPLEDHVQWFTDKLRSANSWLFVLEAQGIAVGQVRFDREDDGVWIDYSLDRLVRGRGWGPQLIRMGAESLPLPAGTLVKARVKKANAASAAVFRRLEFSESGAGDVLVFTTQLGRLRP